MKKINIRINTVLLTAIFLLTATSAFAGSSDIAYDPINKTYISFDSIVIKNVKTGEVKKVTDIEHFGFQTEKKATSENQVFGKIKTGEVKKVSVVGHFGIYKKEVPVYKYVRLNVIKKASEKVLKYHHFGFIKTATPSYDYVLINSEVDNSLIASRK